MEKKGMNKKILAIILASFLAIIVIFFSILAIIYFQTPEKELEIGANIENLTLNKDRSKVYVKLNAGSNDKNITSVKFIFRDFDEVEYVFETVKGTDGISVPYDGNFFDWVLKREKFSGNYSYEIDAEDLGLENFDNIKEVDVVLTYETNDGPVDSPILDTQTTPAAGSTGSSSSSSPPINNCVVSCNGKECGDDGCGGNCGECGILMKCESGKCIEEERIKGFDLTDNVLILYNENALDAREIAEYYANARGIDYSQLCAIRMPTGQFAHVKYLEGARKTIVKECLCPLIPDLTGGCTISNMNEIAEKSPITHLAIVRGIPPRLYGTVWNADDEEPSLDYYLSLMLYNESVDFLRSNGGNPPKSNWPNAPYYGLVDDNIDFQTDDSIYGYVRPIVPSFDRIVAYGRVEAMTKQKTFDLIDRTINAEMQGLSGKYFMAIPNPAEHVLSKFFYDLTESEEQCVDYIKNFSNFSYANCSAWPYDSCRIGITGGEIPGEIGSIIPQAYNASIFMGTYLDGEGIFDNFHNAFDGFNNMLNWRKTDAACIPLCKDTLDPDACMGNSTDFFKELNTDCVGVADGFLGWQYRSWPVQYYGFWPYGWGSISGGNGGFEKTPPIILEGGAYQDNQFMDDKYLHFGSLDADPNPECVLENGSTEDCLELVAVNIRQSIDISPSIYIAGNRNFTIRFRHRNPANQDAKIAFKLWVYFDSASHSSTFNKYVDLNSEAVDWTTKEINFTINGDGESINQILLDVFSNLSSPLNEWVDLDGFEFIDSGTGENLADISKSSFNRTNEWTAAGDYASNVIDRLGGIAWWGSASHFETGGNAFRRSSDFVGSFFAGRSLGESLAYIGELGMSGIIYGDPLYRPSGVKIFMDDGLNELNNFTGHMFTNTTPSIGINAFHGLANLDTVNWEISVCNHRTLDECEGQWSSVRQDTKAVFGYEVFNDISSLVPDLNINQFFVLRLRVWNLDEPENMLTNYAYFDYRADTDRDGIRDDWEWLYFGELTFGPDDDPDGDLFLNYEEYDAETNPSDSTNHSQCILDRHCAGQWRCHDNLGCVGCIEQTDCGGNDVCWINYSCETITCQNNSDCEDFDDCSEDRCVNGLCEFTKFVNQEDCYYCANFSYCNLYGEFNICGGADINHNGSVGQEDFNIFSEWFNSVVCNESNLFCNYSDIDRKALFSSKIGTNLEDLIIYKAHINDTCNLEPWRACELGRSSEEVCDDGFDNDCDGDMDCDDDECFALCGIPALSPLKRIWNWLKNYFLNYNNL